jgi:hypothetical protein
MPNRIDTPEYWIEDFSPTPEERDLLIETALETMRPYTTEELAAIIVRHRVEQAMAARAACAKAGGTPYQPSDRFEVGQKIVFPALDNAVGVVEGIRPGNNPYYGSYEVIQVKIGRQKREFAAAITWDHALNNMEVELDPDELTAAYAPVVAPQIASMLSDDKEWLLYGSHWVLKALLPEINAGHVNLAEAIIMLAGEPLPPEQILAELELDEEIPLETRSLALTIALSGDSRFRNVGAHESPLWALQPTS